jgi:hypothetical protein
VGRRRRKVPDETDKEKALEELIKAAKDVSNTYTMVGMSSFLSYYMSILRAKIEEYEKL